MTHQMMTNGEMSTMVAFYLENIKKKKEIEEKVTSPRDYIYIGFITSLIYKMITPPLPHPTGTMFTLRHLTS